jgi:hypothetical protein
MPRPRRTQYENIDTLTHRKQKGESNLRRHHLQAGAKETIFALKTEAEMIIKKSLENHPCAQNP